jgi:hydrogenase maturation protease
VHLVRCPLPDAARRRPLTIVGVGTQYRGDDAAGLEVARLLSSAAPASGARVVAYDGEPSGLLSVWEGAEEVWIADAAVFDAPPGTVRRIVVAGWGDPADGSASALLSGLRGVSTHALGVADVLALAATLGRLPARVVVHAISGADFGLGAPVSPPVMAAARATAGVLRAELNTLPAGP